jgi:hypothetical protein
VPARANVSIALRIPLGSGKHFDSMVIRKSFGFGLALFLLVVGGACRRSEPEPPKPAMKIPEKPNVLARLHWVGQEQLRANTNAAYLTNLLQVPEAPKMGEEVLQKLSRAPWTSLIGLTNSPAASNELSGLFLTLLRKVADNEVCLEAQRLTNQPPDLAMAVKLNVDDAALWTSNSHTILNGLNGLTLVESTASAGTMNWRWEKGERTNYIQVQAVGGWSLIGLGGRTNSVLDDFVSRIQRANSPVEEPGTNHWLELYCDFASILPTLSVSWPLSIPPPKLNLNLSGQGEYIKTEGQLEFAEPLNLDREPWMIPTNMIREPLVSFGAFQGIRPWLKTIQWIQDLQLTNTPNQFFTWSLNTSPLHVFAATPFPNALSEVDRFGPGLEKKINTWVTNNANGAVEFSPPNHGIGWVPVPLLTPAFQALPGLDGGFLFGRFAPSLPPPGQTAPPELLNRITARTNLVYYDWEITETRLKQWLFTAQSLRVAFHRAQLPGDCLSLGYLKAISPKLGNTVTEVLQTGPSTLSFVRKSHCGFTGLELHVLADWVESPVFPFGLHSQLVDDGGFIRWNAKTKSMERGGKAAPTK